MSPAVTPAPEVPKSLWDFLAQGDAGNSARIIEEFQRRVSEWEKKIPPGIIPDQELRQQMLDKALADAIASFPGLVRSAIDEVKPALFALISKGKGPISHDSSALA
jgi:hypothetical protein